MIERKEEVFKPVIGISIGDLNGVGPEIIIKTLSDTRILKHLTPVIYASRHLMRYYGNSILPQISYNQTSSATHLNPNKVNLINLWNEQVEINPGIANKEIAKYAQISLEESVQDLRTGKIHALITAPVNKELMQSQKFNFPGHTEYLTEKAGKQESLMLMVDSLLKVGVVTGHISLNQVAEKITKKNVSIKLTLMLRSLQLDFGIQKPKVAILGLNPHAGENGLLGKEDQEIIEPVINEFKKRNHLIFGPFPADGFFGMNLFKNYDAVLAMYHDQGLIPFKTLAFHSGVNFTAGLPFIRTSPDHGTAFSIAGKNQADETSFRNALYLAKEVVWNRMNN